MKDIVHNKYTFAAKILFSRFPIVRLFEKPFAMFPSDYFYADFVTLNRQFLMETEVDQLLVFGKTLLETHLPSKKGNMNRYHVM